MKTVNELLSDMEQSQRNIKALEAQLAISNRLYKLGIGTCTCLLITVIGICLYFLNK